MTVGMPYLFVAMDLLLISLALPYLSKAFHLPGALAGFVAGSIFIGMMIGASLWGFLADVLGRKRALQLTVTMYAIFTGLSALSWNWISMTILRIVTGIGMGGTIPLCFVYLSEFIPAKHRGKFLVLLDSFWAYGWIMASLLGYLIIPKLGWRFYFLFGTIPILTLIPLQLYLPESVRFLEEKGRKGEAEKALREVSKKAGYTLPKQLGYAKSGAEVKVTVWELWSSKYRRRTLFSWILWFCMVYGYYSFFLWIIKFVAGLGYPVPKAMFYALITSFAQIPGYFLSAWLVDKIGRRPTLTTFLVLTAASIFGFAYSKTSLELIAWIAVISFFCLGAWGVVMTYTAEVYPTRIRGTGYGAASGFGRLAGLIGPTIIGFLLDRYGLFVALTVTSASFLVGALDTLILGIETKGKTLEEISG
ncbi:MAG: MFS transporter [Thermofilum sp. ex4484_15]|nr:MAG: MFS transporter [Thermofilum sp. ex4484_15]